MPFCLESPSTIPHVLIINMWVHAHSSLHSRNVCRELSATSDACWLIIFRELKWERSAISWYSNMYVREVSPACILATIS